MNSNRKFRIKRAAAVGVLAPAGIVGAALLAGPMASSQAALFPSGITYHNGGFCYQNPVGNENTYRLVFSEPDSMYDPNSTGANLTWVVQKWDSGSNQYQDEKAAFTGSSDKAGLENTSSAFNADPNAFCTRVTEAKASQYLGGDVYRFGEYTSTRTVGPQSPPNPKP